MTTPVRTSVSVDIDAPATTTWAEMVDWAGQGRWILGTTVAVVRGTGTAVGDRIEAVTGVGGHGLRDLMEITEYTAPERCVVRHIGAVVRGTGIFEVRAVSPARSRMTWIDDVEPPLGAVGRLGWRIAGKPAFEFGARRSLAVFAALVASGGARRR